MGVVVWETGRGLEDPQLPIENQRLYVHTKIVTPAPPFTRGGYAWQAPKSCRHGLWFSMAVCKRCVDER